MWKQSEDGGIKIKIIDWDCAHCLAEGRFSPQVESALKDHAPKRLSPFGPDHDLRYLRVLEAERSPDGLFDVHWKALASKSKVVIDKATACSRPCVDVTALFKQCKFVPPLLVSPYLLGNAALVRLLMEGRVGPS